jgi:hypothetical protein
LLKISTPSSNRIIKRGDYFNIYVDVLNGFNKQVTIKEIRFSQTMGFKALTEKMVRQVSIAIFRRFANRIKADWKKGLACASQPQENASIVLGEGTEVETIGLCI